MREMKDSGIEWIGKIPLGWRSTRLKFICKKIADGSHFSPDTVEEGYPYLTAADIHGKDIAYDKSLKIGKEDYMALVKAGCKPELGDTLLVKDGATTGRTGILKKNINCVLLSSVAMLHGKTILSMMNIFGMHYKILRCKNKFHLRWPDLLCHV